MKNFIILFILCFAGFAAQSQFIHKIKADSVLITNDSCNAELNLENSTKNVLGFLYNKGRGRTEFRKALIKFNDSLYDIGSDTLNLGSMLDGNFWKLTGNAGTNPAINFLGTTDAQSLVFKTNNTEKATIDTSGRIGIGTASPTAKLHVSGTGLFTDEVTFKGGARWDSLSYANWNYVRNSPIPLNIVGTFDSLTTNTPAGIMMQQTFSHYKNAPGAVSQDIRRRYVLDSNLTRKIDHCETCPGGAYYTYNEIFLDNNTTLSTTATNNIGLVNYWSRQQIRGGSSTTNRAHTTNLEMSGYLSQLFVVSNVDTLGKFFAFWDRKTAYSQGNAVKNYYSFYTNNGFSNHIRSWAFYNANNIQRNFFAGQTLIGDSSVANAGTSLLYINGSVRGITESTADSSRNLASTEWVKKQGYSDSTGTISRGIIQSSTYTLTSTTSLQKLFNANGGSIAVSGNTTYEFECMFSLSSMSSSSGNCGFNIIGAGTATLTNATWSVVGGIDGTTLSTSATSNSMFSENSAETGNIVNASTGQRMFAVIKGIIRVNAGGTLIPSVNLTNSAAAVTSTNSYFKVKPIGNNSVTSW